VTASRQPHITIDRTVLPPAGTYIAQTICALASNLSPPESS
jgi:hypothetical protein